MTSSGRFPVKERKGRVFI